VKEMAEEKKEVVGRTEGIISIIRAVAAFVLGLLAQ
jgi:hypothetical protein